MPKMTRLKYIPGVTKHISIMRLVVIKLLASWFNMFDTKKIEALRTI